MQDVSPALADALAARVREPIARLRVDWDRSGSYTDLLVKDLSADITSISLSRELSTDLPVQAKLFAGLAAAEATVTLAHRDPTDPAHHAAWYYSGLNVASPLYAYDRKGAPALLEVGLVTEDGPEYVTVLTGYVRSLDPSSGGRSAIMRITDGAETMRGQITLPMIVADGQNVSLAVAPNLSTTFLADWVLRACGYYASPPVRANCLLAATMAESGHPEVGSIFAFHGANNSPLGYIPGHTADAARWVRAVVTDGGSDQEIRYNLDNSGGATSTDNGSEFFYQGWHKFTPTTGNAGFFMAFETGGGLEPSVSGGYRTATSTFNVVVRRGGAEGTTIRTAVGPVIVPGTSWHYYACHVVFTATGFDVTFRYDDTTTGPVHVATASVPSEANFNTAQIAQGWVSATELSRLDGYTEAVQITREPTPGPWDDAFVPTSDVIASAGVYYRIEATPPTVEEAWTLFQQLAEAEFHTAGFSEKGVPFWWPRDRWLTPPYSAPVATLDAKVNLKELASTEATDQVANRIIIRATQVEVLPTAVVWKATMRHPVEALTTRIMRPQFDTPAANVDTSVTYTTAFGSSQYHASTVPNGSGAAVSNLGFVVTPYAQSAVIEVTNPNAFRVWLVGNTGVSGVTAGDASLFLYGQPVIFDQSDNTRLRVEVNDPASIAVHHEQLLELPAGPFRQNLDQVEGLAIDLLVVLADPPPALTDLPVVADFRLQLADRVSVVDLEGLAFADEFYLSKVNLDVTPGEGMSMLVSLRGAP